MTQAILSEIHSILILLHVDNFISCLNCKLLGLFDSIKVDFLDFRRQQVTGE